MARYRRAVVAAVNHEIMALRLAGNGSIDCRVKRLIAFGCPQRRTEAPRTLLSQAQEYRAGTGHPHAIAGFTEVVVLRRDEARPASILLDLHIAGGPAGPVVKIFERE